MFEPHGLFYGSNARSGNPILADRRSHMNSNGFVLGTSGGGKSFTVKQEIAGMFLNRDDEVIVIDPEREYLALAAAFGGQIIQISAGTGTRVNPMDIVLEDDSASDPVKDKTNNVVSMIGALIGGITVGVMAAKHKTVRRQPAANSYVVQDSLHLTQQSDLFLYANTTRTARPKDNDRSGSDAHSGSGGSSFGGGGGKF